MGNVWGEKIKLSIFGESHGKCIGIVIDGLPAGVELDLGLIEKEMERRKPGANIFSTPRKEGDKPEIISGFFEGKTTGTPLCIVINNSDTVSKDYNKSIIRPGHADYTGFVKYMGFNDYRGGGHFSGRLTACLVFAGAIAKQILNKQGIIIGSHINKIREIKDIPFDKVNVNETIFNNIINKDFPVIDEKAKSKMQELIINAKENLDSIGGEIECAIIGIKEGIGNPFFDSIESKISSIIFSIPAVKGIEFGSGFEFGNLYGSEANDSFYIKDNKVLTSTNNNGGINGGISNGMPIIFNVVIKPTPSIGKKQNTIDILKKENVELEIQGRHDACILQRAVVVIESCAAIAILDLV